MSSYDPDSIRDMRPRTMLEKFVAAYTKSDAEKRAEILAACKQQGENAKQRRAVHALKRPNSNANWLFIGGALGNRDAYIEEELEAKRKAQAAQ